LLLDQDVLESLNFKCFILQQVMFSAELVEPGVFYQGKQVYFSIYSKPFKINFRCVTNRSILGRKQLQRNGISLGRYDDNLLFKNNTIYMNGLPCKFKVLLHCSSMVHTQCTNIIYVRLIKTKGFTICAVVSESKLET
jgi:hypothetical protein